MRVKNHEILYLYNSNLLFDRQNLGYLLALKDHVVKDLDVNEESVTERQLKNIAYKLNVNVDEMIDKRSMEYRSMMKNKDFEEEDVLRTIKHNPNLLRTPIAIYSDKAFFVNSAYDFVNHDMAMSGVTPNHRQSDD